MPVRTPDQCLANLRVLYRDAHKCEPASDSLVLDWANHPEAWAELQVRHRGWSYFAVEAVVRSCRALRTRAAVAVQPASTDPFDPLMPCALPAQQGGGAVIPLHPTDEPA